MVEGEESTRSNAKPSLKNLHFDGTPAMYEEWRKGVTIWRKICGLKPEEQGCYLILCLSGKAYSKAVDLEDTSIDSVMKLFEELYGHSKSTDIVTKYEIFDAMKREKDEGLQDYIHTFENRVAELKKLGLIIPDLMLGIKLIKGADLAESEVTMVKLSVGQDVTLVKAKTALLTLSDNYGSSSSHSSSTKGLIKVKQEPEPDITFYTKAQGQRHIAGEYSFNYPEEQHENDVFYYNNNSNQRGNYRPPMHGNSRQSNYQFNNGNQNNRGSFNMKCFGCGGIGHIARHCPNVQNGQSWNEQPSSGNHTMHRYNSGNSRPPYNQERRQGQNYQNRSTYFMDDHPHPDSSDRTNECYHTQPDSYHNSDSNEKHNSEPNPIFFQSNVGNETEEILLVGETVNKAILDSGASETVCGREWYTCFVDSLDKDNKSSVQEYPSSTVFKFGVGKLQATTQAIIPVTLCGRDIRLNVHIVESDLPLLLSRKTMKKLGMEMIFAKDTVQIGEDSFDLHTTSSGHYTLPLLNKKYTSSKSATEAVNEIFLTNSWEDVKKTASRLHRRFAHASSSQIIRLLQNAKMCTKELEEELIKIDNSCEFCLKHQRAKPRPIVSLPLAERFNELVAIDLKMINKTWVLHCVDYVTRFSSAHVIKSNHEPDDIIDKFFKIWIWVFGPPKKIFSDNEGGLVGSKFQSMCAAFNIIHKTTAAESPFSNGLCERHNALIGNMTDKVQQDVGCTISIALMWAIHAKNSLINVHGFSPYQLVFGTNPNLPGNSTNKLPAMSDSTCSKAVADHLNSLKSAREAFMQAENSDRIRRALRGRIYEGTHQKFCIGDVVYYKRLGSKEWKGPGKVIAQDGDQVLVKSGARSLVKVHPCKLVLKHEADQRLNDTISDDHTYTQVRDHTDVTDESNNPAAEIDLPLIRDQPITLTDSNINQPTPEEIPQQTESEDSSPVTMDENEPEAAVDTIDTSTAEHSEIETKTNTTPKSSEKVKIGSSIIFRDPEKNDNEWTIGRVISRGGKATGNLKNYWNVELSNGNSTGLNLDNIDWILKPVDIECNDKTSATAVDADDADMFATQIQEEILTLNTIISSNDEKFADAKQEEKDKWDRFKVYEKVNRQAFPDTDVLHCRWVTGEKQVDGGVKYKARLVIKGFEEKNPPLSDSPTANKSILRMCICLSTLLSFKVTSSDIRAAFLQSDPIDRTILVKPPKEFRESKEVWRLHKPVYGLNDASKKWFLTVKKRLTELGCKPLRLDISVYSYYSEGNLSGLIVVHVDDFLCAGNETFKKNVLQPLESIFEIGSHNENRFKYIGWNIRQEDDGIYVDQIDYQQTITQVLIGKERKNQSNFELSIFETKQYQELLGKLQWISSQSRPDIRFGVLQRSMRCEKALVSDLVELNKVVKRLHKKTLTIKFPQMEYDPQKLEIHAYSDAALSNLPGNVASTHGFVIFLVSGDRCAPLCWASKKIQRVTKQILNAECIALSICIDEAMSMREAIIDTLNLSENSKLEDLIPITAFTDSKSLHDNIISTNQATDLKLRREVDSIRQNIQLKEIKRCVWIPGTQQLADCLTKSTASPDTLIQTLASGRTPHTLVNDIL